MNEVPAVRNGKVSPEGHSRLDDEIAYLPTKMVTVMT